MIRRALSLAIVVVACACATRPKPTKGMIERAANARAVVEGSVRDAQGNPVAGVSVRALPREKDVAWSRAETTDREGRFRIEVVAPGDYGFLISFQGITVVTPRADDPSRVDVRVVPGERRTGVALVFHRDDWETALRSPPPH